MNQDSHLARRLSGIAVLFAAGIAGIALLLRDHSGDVGLVLGNNLADLFGACAFAWPALGFLLGTWLLQGRRIADHWRSLGGYALLFVALEAVLGALPEAWAGWAAGAFGKVMAVHTQAVIGLPGLLLAAVCLSVAGLWLARHDAVVDATAEALRKSGGGVATGVRGLGGRLAQWIRDQRLTRRTIEAAGAGLLRTVNADTARGPELIFPSAPVPEPVPARATSPPPPDAEPDRSEEFAAPGGDAESPGVPASPEQTAEPVRPRTRRPAGKTPQRWSLPPGSLLASDAPLVKIDAVQAFVTEQAKLIDQKLLEFGISGKVVSVTSGPSVILFEWQPAAGVKVSRLETLRDDLKLALKAERIRMVVPIPGKGTVGIEIPHPSPAGVTLGALLAGHPSPRTAGDLPMFLGRVLTGETLVADLTQMPHLLIAGTTGSGKSVCIHTLLVSLLMNRTPDELRLLLIDPKRVEMIAYREVPHLLSEVITDARIAVLKLRWMVAIMEARYKLLAHHACRDLHAFNKLVREEGLVPDVALEQGAVTSRAGLPWIVVAIDELADLMVAKARDVEDALQRLAQMARGVGIHLVVATQRPSVDVLTGVIKANLPSRLSFRVATGIDSRTILDSTGAEQLLGKGDLLFSPTGAPEPTRAQGAWLSPAEIARVIAHWTGQGTPEYAPEDDLAVAQEGGSGGGDGEEDSLYEEAVGVVVRGGEASVSMLQRKLSIGFARAGRLIDLMERRGVVGPKQGSKVREILSGRPAEGDASSPGRGAGRP